MGAQSKKIKKIGKASALTILFCIPFVLLLGGLAAISSFCFVLIKGLDKEVFTFFGLGAISSATIILTTPMPRIRTIIHELKHVVPVVLTGGRIRKFRASRDNGQVEFSLEEEDIPCVPYIALAPYYWPLFSLPVLIACMLLETQNKPLLALLLGCALTIDVITGISEIHPRQTDFKATYGGFPLAALFIASSYFFWINISLLWVFAGTQGYGYAGYMFMDVIKTEVSSGSLE